MAELARQSREVKAARNFEAKQAERRAKGPAMDILMCTSDIFRPL